MLKELGDEPLVPGARAVSFIHRIIAILPPDLSLNMAARAPGGKRHLTETAGSHRHCWRMEPGHNNITKSSAWRRIPKGLAVVQHHY